LEKKREENCRSAAVKKRPCLTTNGRSLDAFSVTQSIFSFLSTAAAFFVYFFLLKKKSKSLSGLRTIISQGLGRKPHYFNFLKFYDFKKILLLFGAFFLIVISCQKLPVSLFLHFNIKRYEDKEKTLH
jgi:hypothetical protein